MSVGASGFMAHLPEDGVLGKLEFLTRPSPHRLYFSFLCRIQWFGA